MPFGLKWEPKYGPAFLTGIFNILLFLAGWAIIWFNLPNDVKAANASIAELKRSIALLSENQNKHESRIIRTETAVEFIVPALKRIEEKVDRLK